jgi:mono/diheme cytochrome c family protein
MLAASALLLALGIASAPAQEALPPGPGMEETVRLCSTCHGVDIFRNIRRSEAMWEVTIDNMISAGMTISDAEYDTVLAYLTGAMGDAPRR